jgi:hypothetical protein
MGRAEHGGQAAAGRAGGVVGGSLTIALALLLLGSALIYAGWTNRRLGDLLTGNHAKTKGA